MQSNTEQKAKIDESKEEEKEQGDEPTALLPFSKTRHGSVTAETEWIDQKSLIATELDSASKIAESKGDFLDASAKAKAVVETYCAILNHLTSTKADGADTVKCMIQSAATRAATLEALAAQTAVAPMEQRRAAAEQRRSNVFSELVTTEQAYFARLQRMRSGYYEVSFDYTLTK